MEVTPETFDEHLGTEFVAVGPDGDEHALSLVAVDRLGQGPEGHRDPFSLKFEAAGEEILPQQTHRLRHETLGDVEIFLVPLGSADGTVRYEAIFA